MHKYIAIAAAVLVFGLCASISLATERIMPGASLSGSASEIDAPTHEDAITGAGIRGAANGSDALHRHLQPDNTSEPHADSGHANVAADNGSAELTPKARTHGRWQSLLPGVMK